MTETTLDALAPGKRATVVRIEAEGTARKRIAEMGFSPGTVVEMVRRAPMRDPLEFKVRGYFVSIRRAEARMVAVEEVQG